MARQLGVGVVGVGVLGRQHAINIATRIPSARLVAVADNRFDVAQEVANDLGVATAYSSAEEVAQHPDVEALVIVSSDGAHLEGILAAADAGKAVFCEKPITDSLQTADHAIAAVEAAGVQLQIGFMRRYDPAYLTAKNAIDAGKIGTPLFLKNAHRGKDPIRVDRPAGDGCSPQAFIGSNIHDYDNARWILGDEAIAVTAVGTRVVASTSAEGFESAVSIVEFQRGGLADIEYVSATRYGYDVRTEVVGDLGSLFIGNPNGTACVIATSNGLEQPAMDHWLTRFEQTYLVEIEDWVERTLRGEPATITGQDGRAALEIAIAAQDSMRSGAKVRLPISP